MEYHVCKNGNDYNTGSIENPFLTISKAASVVCENDTVVVHEGEYRECVKVKHGAAKPSGRIIFKAAADERVILKGSEIIDNWVLHNEDVYKAVIPNSVFGDYNPYTTIINGDWFVRPVDKFLHTGMVYIGGASLKEVTSVDAIKSMCWFAEVSEIGTVIYANFGEQKPDANIVEINVRESCFVADGQGVNYITVSGFEMCHGATRWSPPTGDQSGLICANWCKGWIIENNHIYNSRCNGVCIGKDKTTGDNYNTYFHRKSAHFYQIESVFEGLQRGWSKENVGSHIVRNNVIHDCGQTGIVGHMGGAFSEIYGNHIYNIQKDDEFYGYEIAGIKLHAAIDTYIHNNNIHHCRPFGIWLDWQAQGARVSSNLMFESETDIIIEVSHGPLTVDNNLFLSNVSVGMVSHGTAFVNNLFGGSISASENERNTPYHFPHSTQVKGYVYVNAGDDRYYNNIFAGGKDIVLEDGTCSKRGTSIYDEHTWCLENFSGRWVEILKLGIKEKLLPPVYINNNSYLGGATPYKHEVNNVISAVNISFEIIEDEGKFYLETDMPENGFADDLKLIGTGDLAPTLYSETEFENADGSPYVIDKDYFGELRNTSPTVGPIECLKPGKNRFLVWK